MQLDLDHLAISAATLAEGLAMVEALLGVALAAGGSHPAMGTHNRLLGLGPGLYLEVIAVDPGAVTPASPRWFDLDRFTGPPRLTHWICRTHDLDSALAVAPPGIGAPMELARGDYRWRMAVPPTGILPFGGAHPALIEWQGDAHPAKALPNSGCRLRRLVVVHPEAADLRRHLGRLSDLRVVLEPGPEAMMAELDTPGGKRVLP